jgi:hypothetical protein
VDFEMFRPDLAAALNYSDGTKGGRRLSLLRERAFVERHGFRSQVQHRRPKGRLMPPHIRRRDGGARRDAAAGAERLRQI